MLLPERQAELGGKRRLGLAVRRGREPAPAGRMPEEVLVGAQSLARPSPRTARAAAQQLPHENFGFLRVREASEGVGLGRELPGRPPERDIIAAHFVFAVQKMPALFPAQSRPVPGKTSLRARERSQTDLATGERNTDQPQKLGETLR